MPEKFPSFSKLYELSKIEFDENLFENSDFNDYYLNEKKFKFMNEIQTQIFRENENFNDESVFIGAPVGSGKSFLAESFIIKYFESTFNYCVLGSDGVWDVLNGKDLINLIFPFFEILDGEGAAKRVVDEAIKLWGKKGKLRDDITCIVVFLNLPQSMNKKYKYFFMMIYFIKL